MSMCMNTNNNLNNSLLYVFNNGKGKTICMWMSKQCLSASLSVSMM